MITIEEHQKHTNITETSAMPTAKPSTIKPVNYDHTLITYHIIIILI